MWPLVGRIKTKSAMLELKETCCMETYIFLDRKTHFQIWSIPPVKWGVKFRWGGNCWSDGCSKMKCVCRPDGASLLSVLAPSYHHYSSLLPSPLPKCTCTCVYLGIPVPTQQCPNVPTLSVPAQRYLHTCMYPSYLCSVPDNIWGKIFVLACIPGCLYQ